VPAAVVGDPDDHAGVAFVIGSWRLDGRCGAAAFGEGQSGRIERAIPEACLAKGGERGGLPARRQSSSLVRPAA
jgi:hypothetical protein